MYCVHLNKIIKMWIIFTMIKVSHINRFTNFMHTILTKVLDNLKA